MGKANKKNTKGKKTAVRPILKISLFTFLVWIAKSCNNDGHYEDANGVQNLGKSQIIRNGRLLSEEPKIEFDSVFSTFKDSFLDKMGLGEQEQNQIKDMMHSYFNNLDFSSLERQVQENPEMFQQFGQIPSSLDEIQIPPNFLEQFPPPPGMLEQFNLPPDVLEKFPPPPHMFQEYQKDSDKFGPLAPFPPSMFLPPESDTSASSDGEPKPSTSASADGEPKPSTSASADGEPKPSTSASADGEPKPSTSASSDGEPKSSTSASADGELKPSTSSKEDAVEKPEPCSGMPGTLPPFPDFEELSGSLKSGAHENVNVCGEIQEGENGVSGNLCAVEPKKDNNKQDEEEDEEEDDDEEEDEDDSDEDDDDDDEEDEEDEEEDGEQEGNKLAQEISAVPKEGKKQKNEEVNEGGKKKENEKHVIVEEVKEKKKSEVGDNKCENTDEEFVEAEEEGDEIFEDAVEKFEDMEQPSALPQFPSKKPQAAQLPEQAIFQPFANMSIPGMPNLDLLFGPQLAKNEETSALTSFVNKLNFFGIDAKSSINATFLVGLAYYNVKYFVYTMMFIVGLNLFRELGDIFNKLRK
ncbi:Plasmodium exported protein, unknown function [Plasmodium knowlesi strain H]|uniref:Pv-fam-h protein n=3 Tax=Plasmodium knowlesi TaxID=5850 RepID=A0A1A7VYJ8_PLAKH|nr:Plasmodium exported protein, unknown function [Plasmodium knowlesi strain H]OTN65984.1 Uncharacterized protein PKNOH_S100028600 [Plasmodium knowlesi]CAA9987652.1 Plasmodium exported protein, unknown function [Plasmodium knowlesi strain H]SBO26864.1 Plasmodium exported protein, unknown function [Plasmodium knowlesi strain H]SBO29670.1 Plasmodium exported protein, unknown function [Plasmodium knowlesi strain H]VVS77126.1 Plasmodium exported protein, unknown function [Plasmodium knowlesi strai